MANRLLKIITETTLCTVIYSAIGSGIGLYFDHKKANSTNSTVSTNVDITKKKRGFFALDGDFKYTKRTGLGAGCLGLLVGIVGRGEILFDKHTKGRGGPSGGGPGLGSNCYHPYDDGVTNWGDGE